MTPKGPNWKQFLVWLTPEQHERVRREAYERRISMAEVVREAIERAFPLKAKAQGK